MAEQMIIVGAGIGGLAAALACSRAGAAVQVLEQSAVLAEVGAGVQLGPNVTGVLHSLGLETPLRQVAAVPSRLEVRNAIRGNVLGVLPLGQDMVRRYGAPYVTVARADLHSVLLSAVQACGVQITLGAQVTTLKQDAQAVEVGTAQGLCLRAPVLVGADGVWSQVRALTLADGAARATGHLAYRAMVPQADLPAALRSQVVIAWMGPNFHVVQYPVRGGEWLNVVAIVRAESVPDLRSWDHSANAAELRVLLANAGTGLIDLIHAISHWRLWALCDRPPMRSAAEHVQGRVALLGDAAHPMRPYLAQGAGMAVEDAAALAQVLAPALTGNLGDVRAALVQFARSRWQRNARVQAQAIRNGQIFHMHGPLRLARDGALKLLGRRVLDMPWLYAGPPQR